MDKSTIRGISFHHVSNACLPACPPAPGCRLERVVLGPYQQWLSLVLASADEEKESGDSGRQIRSRSLSLSIAPSIFAANQTLLRSQTVYLCALTGRVRYGRFLEPVHFNVPSNVSQRNKLYELGPGVIRVGTRKSHVATECAPAAISRIRKMPKAGGRRSICALYKHTHVRSA